MTTIQLLRNPALELHEADILAELPSLSGWAPVPPTPLLREVLDELPAIAGIQEPGV
jgi:hypothetical protein